jgi:hypothetical protein
MMAMYHWHPYELQAFIWGLLGGAFITHLPSYCRWIEKRLGDGAFGIKGRGE